MHLLFSQLRQLNASVCRSSFISLHGQASLCRPTHALFGTSSCESESTLSCRQVFDGSRYNAEYGSLPCTESKFAGCKFCLGAITENPRAFKAGKLFASNKVNSHCSWIYRERRHHLQLERQTPDLNLARAWARRRRSTKREKQRHLQLQRQTLGLNMAWARRRRSTKQ